MDRLEIDGLVALEGRELAKTNGGIYGPPPPPPPPWVRQRAEYYLQRHIEQRQARRPAFRPVRGPF